MPSQKNRDDEPVFDNDDFQQGERRVRIKRRRYHPTKLGGLCVNAATGQRYPIAQGSFEELRLFKMIDATAFYDKDGFLLEKNQSNPDSNILYYDSPEEYMRHMKTRIAQEDVNRWHMNVKRMFPDGGEFDKAAYDAIKLGTYVGTKEAPKREVSSEDEW